jgi:hypothetical protein
MVSPKPQGGKDAQGFPQGCISALAEFGAEAIKVARVDGVGHPLDGRPVAGQDGPDAQGQTSVVMHHNSACGK